jgi:integrase
MGVYQRAGAKGWYVEFEFQGERFRRAAQTTSRSKAEALERQWRRDLHEQRLLGAIVPLSLGEACDRYVATVLRPRCKPESLKREEYVLQRLQRHFGDATELSEIKARDVVSLRDRLLGEGKAPATANRYLAPLKAILRRAQSEWGALAAVPAIKLLPLRNWRYRWLTEEEERRLLAAAPDHLRALIIFLCDTGARLGEALTLTWANVDLDRSPRGIVRFMETKSGRPRAVPLTDRVAYLLRRWRSTGVQEGEHVFVYRPEGRGNGACVNPGKPRPYRRPHRAWHSAAKAAGLADVRLHDLRHTFASRLVMRGAPLATVSRLLGHASIQMTMRYAHLAPEAFDIAVATLDGVDPRTAVSGDAVSVWRSRERGRQPPFPEPSAASA